MSDTATIKDTSALVALFGDNAKATVTRTSEVTVPKDLCELFARAVTAFASAPNTAVVTEDKDTADGASLYAKQIRQYAKDTNRTAIVKINGERFVTWRFSTVTPSARGKSRKVNPVTVTKVA